MDHYAGIDVLLEQSSVCVVDATGRIVREAKVASEPEPLITFLRGLTLPLARIGLEAGPLSQWLQAALVKAGFEAVLLETRHVKAALSAMIVKTDRKDARGIAQRLRMGWFRPVHCKSAPAQEVRALLVARKQMQAKMRDVELSLRGLLRGFGLKVGDISSGALLGPEALGAGGGQAARHEASEGGAGAQACDHSPPHLGGWHDLPLGPGGRGGVEPRGGAVWSGARSALLS